MAYLILTRKDSFWDGDDFVILKMKSDRNSNAELRNMLINKMSDWTIFFKKLTNLYRNASRIMTSDEFSVHSKC